MSGLDPVRLPADVDQPDKIVFGLTGRQALILGATGVVVWGAYLALGSLVPLPVFLAVVIVIGAAGASAALGRRDGLGFDQLLVAGLVFARSPRRLVLAPEGVPALPAWARHITRSAGMAESSAGA